MKIAAYMFTCLSVQYRHIEFASITEKATFYYLQNPPKQIQKPTYPPHREKNYT